MLTQFAIVIGIMVTQSMGIRLATPHRWRLVLLFSSVLAIAGLLAGTIMVESPVWLARHGLLRNKDALVRRLWKGVRVSRIEDGMSNSPYHSIDLPTPNPLTLDPTAGEDAEDPLLAGADERSSLNPDRRETQHQAAVTIPQAIFRAEFRHPLAIVCYSMLCQQLSGMYFVLLHYI